MKDLYSEYRQPDALKLERDFYAGDSFRWPTGGYVNRWMLPAGEYRVRCPGGNAQCVVTVSVAQHLTELEEMISAGLGNAGDPQIVEWSFPRFCHLCDMRILYCNRQKMTVNELRELIRNTANIPANVS